MSSKRPLETTVIGKGKLAHAMLPLLPAAGYPLLAVAGRGDDIVDAVRGARLVLLAVPDTALTDVAATLAGADQGWKGRTVLHHAGALGLEPLLPLKKRSASVGLLHPLQCLGGSVLATELLPGSHARIEGTAKARTVARRLALDLGLVPLPLRGALSAADRSASHAAASLVSNDLLALVALGADLLESVGLKRTDAIRALLPLAEGTLAQAGGDGPASALSGPVVRGDVETVESHLKSLARRSRPAAEIHGLLSQSLLRLSAAESGQPAPAARRRLRAALVGAPRRRYSLEDRRT
jgi:predicted short-subunit dehydrogenase-like oxidoreductase (DUF2520 family)